jgi:hypothetical protein
MVLTEAQCTVLEESVRESDVPFCVTGHRGIEALWMKNILRNMAKNTSSWIATNAYMPNE